MMAHIWYRVWQVMMALEEERRMPLSRGEGPFGLIICPSRELARQTYEVAEGFIEALEVTITHYLLPTAYYVLHHLLYHLLPTTNHLLPTAYCLLYN